MLKVILKTDVPEWCKFKNCKVIVFKQIWLDRDDRIKALLIFKSKREKSFRVIRNHECDLARAILNSGAIVSSAELRSNEIIWILVCTQNEFKELTKNLDKLRDNYDLNYEIIWKSKFSGEFEGLSYIEEEILRLALEQGYFDCPKRIKLEDLAEIFELSKSTISELMRRALKKVIRLYFLNLID